MSQSEKLEKFQTYFIFSSYCSYRSLSDKSLSVTLTLQNIYKMEYEKWSTFAKYATKKLNERVRRVIEISR